MLFLEGGIDLLEDNVKSDYVELIDCGIIYTKPKSLALKVNDVSHDVDGWWFSENIQNSIFKFCNKYARYSSSPVRDFLGVINELKI